MKGLSDLLLNGDDRGLRFFDSADSYGSHPHIAEALKHVPRDKVTVLTKTLFAMPPEPAPTSTVSAASSAPTTGRFPHALRDRSRLDRPLPRSHGRSFGSQTKKGIIRTHGCSCHSIEALRAAAKSPWVEIHLAQINPVGAVMDAAILTTVVGVLKEMKASGKAIIGMKILGQGACGTVRMKRSNTPYRWEC